MYTAATRAHLLFLGLFLFLLLVLLLLLPALPFVLAVAAVTTRAAVPFTTSVQHSQAAHTAGAHMS